MASVVAAETRAVAAASTASGRPKRVDEAEAEASYVAGFPVPLPLPPGPPVRLDRTQLFC